MKQYCRYCTYLVTGNGIYCMEKGKTMSESSTKTVNKCQSFIFNPTDAYDLDREYKPREPVNKQCDGQVELFGGGRK